MTVFKLSYKNFIRNKFLAITGLLIILLLICAGTYQGSFSWFGKELPDFVLHLNMQYLYVIPLTLLLTFYSFESFRKLDAYCETVSVRSGSMLRLYGCQLLMDLLYLIILSFIAFVFVYLQSVMQLGLVSNALPVIIRSLFFGFFIPCACCVCVGIMLSRLGNRIIAYVFIVLFALSSSGILSSLTNDIYGSTGLNLYKLFNIINIVPSGLLFTPNYAVGREINYEILSIICFWIFLSVMVTVLRAAFITKKAKAITLAFCLMLCVVSMCSYLQDFSSPVLNWSIYGSGAYETAYYNDPKNIVENEIPADFTVLKYEMDLRPAYTLHAVVKVYPKETELERYRFTLFNGYKVKRVVDQDGKDYDFLQSGDHITVFAPRPVECFEFRYSGCSHRYYSNNQNIYLPGCFAYYPVPGHLKLYDAKEYQSYLDVSLNYETQFEVRITGPKRVLSNLPCNEDGLFAGKAECAYFVNGYYDSATIDGITVYYPEFDPVVSSSELSVAQFPEMKKLGIKAIYIMPNVNNKIGTEAVRATSAAVFSVDSLPSDFAIIQAKTKSLKKYVLANQMFAYSTAKEPNNYFDGIIKDKEYLNYLKSRGLPVEELAELLTSGNAQEKYDAIIDYLWDADDNRSVNEFIEELMKNAGN